MNELPIEPNKCIITKSGLFPVIIKGITKHHARTGYVTYKLDTDVGLLQFTCDNDNPQRLRGNTLLRDLLALHKVTNYEDLIGAHFWMHIIHKEQRTVTLTVWDVYRSDKASYYEVYNELPTGAEFSHKQLFI